MENVGTGKSIITNEDGNPCGQRLNTGRTRNPIVDMPIPIIGDRMRAQQESRAVRVDITTLLDLKNSCDNSCGTTSCASSGRFARVAAGIAIGVRLVRAKTPANEAMVA